MQVQIQEYLNDNASRENLMTIVLLQKWIHIKRKIRKEIEENNIKNMSFRGANKTKQKV